MRPTDLAEARFVDTSMPRLLSYDHPLPTASPMEKLAPLRAEIEQIDRAIIRLIADRVRLAREVGAVKHEMGLPTLDPAREAAVVRRAGELAREVGLADEDVRYIFWHLIGLSRRAQMEEG